MKTLIPALFSLLSVAVFAGDFSLRTLSDGSAEISAYTGTETSLYIPASVDGKRISRIGAKAFFNNRELTSVTLPSGLTEISESAFALCTNLKCVTFPSSLKTIGESAFFSCKKLSSIELPNSLEFLGDKAFALCSSLEDVSAPTFVRHIGKNVFPLSSATLFPPSKFPLLEIVPDANSLVDASDDKIIDGNENCELRIPVKNNGNADAYGCRFNVALKEPNAALTLPRSIGITKIPAGESVVVTIPVAASIELEKGKAQFTFSLDEPRGLSARSRPLGAGTRPFAAPKLEVVASLVEGTPKRNATFVLNLKLQNLASGTAENVRAKIELPPNVILYDSKDVVDLPKLPRGKAEDLKFKMLVPGSYSADTIPVKVKLSEKYGKYAKDFETTLRLQSGGNSWDPIDIAGEGGSTLTDEPIEPEQFASEVDTEIPENPVDSSRNIFALIIANENYEYGTAPVHFAKNDGKIFRDYCLKTLGVPENQIRFRTNADFREMKRSLKWLIERGGARNAELVFYYSGHGNQDEATRDSYLLPTDSVSGEMDYVVKLKELYEELGASKAKVALAFVDACFSGMGRDDNPLVAGKGLRRPPKRVAAQKNLIVFTAASGDQTAGFARDEKHGLFTYVLLKKLQESRGNISLSELKDHLGYEVYEQSLKIGDRKQKPSILVHEDFPHMNQKLYTPKED